jgi:2-polyprenyl-3-methyl-5-hydroxy-6-metoxy-1,4-benzoquinol methylase
MNIEKYAKVAPQSYTDEFPELLTEIIGANSFPIILDCGCGDGSLLYSLFKRKLVKKSKVYAISQKRIRLVKRISSKIKAKVDSAESLKTIKTGSIDLLISTQVIEHVDHHKMVDAISRVTRNGSVIYLSTVFKKWYGWFFYKNDIGWVIDPTHLREYTEDSQLIKLFKDNYRVILSKKTLQWFPIADFITKRIGIGKRNKDGIIWKIIRLLRVPIFGYYNWELVLVKI